MLDAEVVIAEVDVEPGQDQLLADPLPDDAGHLVAVELDDGVLHLDLGHGGCALSCQEIGLGAVLSGRVPLSTAGLSVVSPGRTA